MVAQAEVSAVGHLLSREVEVVDHLELEVACFLQPWVVVEEVAACSHLEEVVEAAEASTCLEVVAAVEEASSYLLYCNVLFIIQSK